MTAKEFYNSKAIKHQLKRAIKHDKKYFEDAIIELMEMYAQEQVKNIAYEPVLAPVDYEYEHLFISDESEPCPIDGWMPIATERIKHPEKIPEYIERGRLRLIKPQ